jgi:hypothetical protein
MQFSQTDRKNDRFSPMGIAIVAVDFAEHPDASQISLVVVVRFPWFKKESSFERS